MHFLVVSCSLHEWRGSRSSREGAFGASYWLYLHRDSSFEYTLRIPFRSRGYIPGVLLKRVGPKRRIAISLPSLRIDFGPEGGRSGYSKEKKDSRVPFVLETA